MEKLDDIDIKILRILQDDAKTTNKEIAAALGLTTTPVFERIKKLERQGIIDGYSARINREKVGQHIVAFCHVYLKEHAQDYIEKFEERIMLLEEVIECHHIAGDSDYLLKIIVPDMPSYRDFMSNKLAAIEHIGRVQSSFVMKEIKYGQTLNL